MQNIQTLKQLRKDALDKADAILKAAEAGQRKLSETENTNLNDATKEVEALNGQIETIEKANSLVAKFNGRPVVTESNRPVAGKFAERLQKKQLTPEYVDSFFAMITSGGKDLAAELIQGRDASGGFALPGFLPRNPKVGATLYEGVSGAGGYAVPISVDDQIVPLAPQEMAVRRVSMVIPTTHDIKFPTKTAFGTATAKAETSAFTESDPTLGQFTLSAYMAGIQETISWELAQDVPAFQAFAVDDMILAQQMYEENLYVNGSGSGQAQGLIGNVGAGVTEEPDSNGNLVSIAGTLDILGKLNAVYHPNASWLMQRATSIIIRKAQMQSNLFFPAFTRVGTQDFLHGYPVEYVTAMPTAARGAAPCLFGDFKRGYIIGDRGGSGINVKVLDQPQAQNGLLVLLAYRRTDGRVRRSEAIQQYNVAAS